MLENTNTKGFIIAHRWLSNMEKHFENILVTSREPLTRVCYLSRAFKNISTFS